MEFQSIIKWVHILAGTIALLSGLMAILLRKKTPKHKPFGKIYFYAMTVIFFTAIYLSIHIESIFLFCVAFFTYHAALTAYRSLKLKKLHEGQKPLLFDWIIEVVFSVVHLSFVLFSIYCFTHDLTEAGIVSGIFGSIGVWNNYTVIKRFTKRPLGRNYWLKAHIGGMLGSYIGAITAFVVNNQNHIPLPGIVLWLGPTALIVPLIVIELRKYSK